MKLSNGPRENRRRHTQSGFALIIALWGVGLIAFLILSFVSAANLRIRSTLNDVGSAQASALAAAAINIAILDRELASQANAACLGGRGCDDPASLSAALGSLPIAGVRNSMIASAISRACSVDGEKWTKNSSRLALLAAFKSILPRSSSTAIAASAPWGREHIAAAPLYGNRVVFQTALELDQVHGMTSELFARVLPFVTVHSGLAEIDRSAASPILIATLSGAGSDGTDGLTNGAFPNDAAPGGSPHQSLENGTFLIHVDVRMTNGARQSQEAVVAMSGADGSGGFSIKEWRRGRQR